jgi:hypothetical protein
MKLAGGESFSGSKRTLSPAIAKMHRKDADEQGLIIALFIALW